MRISTKLYVGFGLLLLLIAGLGELVAYDMSRVDAGLRQLADGDIPAVKAHVELARYLTMEATQAHLYILKPSPSRLVAAHSAEILFKDSLRDAERIKLSVRPYALADLTPQLIDFQTQLRRAENLARSGDTAAALRFWELHVSPMVNALSQRLERLRSASEDETLRGAISLQEHTFHLRFYSILGVIMALVVATAATAAIMASLLRPIRRLVGTVEDVRGGDLTARVKWPYEDELGGLAVQFNNMVERIGSTMDELHEAQGRLTERNEALTDAYTRVRQEMELAAKVQQAILPPTSGYREIKVAADMIAAGNIGGDFYDLYPGFPGSQQLAFSIGDVSGKGIAAALMMVFIVTALREIVRRETGPAGMLKQLNRLLEGRFNSEQELFSTCFLGILDRPTLQLTYAKAGHEEPYWYHAETGVCEPLRGTGLFVGIFPDGGYESRRVQLAPGDRLVLYTDGIVEARCPDGVTFGHDRLIEVICKNGRGSAADIANAIRTAADSWMGGAIPRDDRTLLVLEVPAAAVATPGAYPADAI